MFGPVSSTSPNMFILVLLASQLISGLISAAASAGDTAAAVEDKSKVLESENLLSRSPERGGVGLGIQRELQRREELKSPLPATQPLLNDLNELDERLSIIVTDKNSTSAITFSEVMERLAGDVHVDKLPLFRRWWDTARKSPGLAGDATNVFCDSQSKEVDSLSKKNGFPYRCPREEGLQADADPFADDAPRASIDDCDKSLDAASSLSPRSQNEDGYTAIAFSNRFDLADKDFGLHCGEYRIIFAKNSGFRKKDEDGGLIKSDDRNLIIFEALVPNPRPPEFPEPTTGNMYINLKGCRPIVEFWRSLSNPKMSTLCRGKALRDFFMEGLPHEGIGRVVDTRNYAGGPTSGQIRTNQFMENEWTLREFKTYGGSIVPATVKSNPGTDFFKSEDPHKADPRKIELAAYLVRKDTLDNLRGLDELKGLAGERNIYSFAFNTTTPSLDHLNSFESNERTSDGDVVEAFDTCKLKESCKDVIADSISAALKNRRLLRRISFTESELKLALDAITTATSTRTSRWLVLRVGRLSIYISIARVTMRYGRLHLAVRRTSRRGFTHVAEDDCEEGKDIKLPEPPRTLANFESVHPARISRLSYMGPDGECSRYKISDTLKLVLMPPRLENMILYLNTP